MAPESAEAQKTPYERRWSMSPEPPDVAAIQGWMEASENALPPVTSRISEKRDKEHPPPKPNRRHTKTKQPRKLGNLMDAPYKSLNHHQRKHTMRQAVFTHPASYDASVIPDDPPKEIVEHVIHCELARVRQDGLEFNDQKKSLDRRDRKKQYRKSNQGKPVQQESGFESIDKTPHASVRETKEQYLDCSEQNNLKAAPPDIEDSKGKIPDASMGYTKEGFGNYLRSSATVGANQDTERIEDQVPDASMPKGRQGSLDDLESNNIAGPSQDTEHGNNEISDASSTRSRKEGLREYLKRNAIDGSNPDIGSSDDKTPGVAVKRVFSTI